MPTLARTLDGTMVLTADPQAEYTRSTGAPVRITPFRHALLPDDWEYALVQPADGPPRVEDLRIATQCATHHAPMPMQVCDRITWTNPKVWLPEGGGELELPLDLAHLLGHFDSGGGYVGPGAEGGRVSGLFTLPTQVQRGAMLVYGYEIDGRTARPFPEPLRDPEYDFPATATADYFRLVDRLQGSLTWPIAVGHPNLRSRSGVVEPLRIFVAVQLVVCHASADFAPLRLAEMGRVYPLVMVVANGTLSRVRAGHWMLRPERSSMSMPDMASSMDSLLTTERNDVSISLAAPPLWDQAFDYYLLSNEPGPAQMDASERFVAVHRRTDGTGRVLDNPTTHRRVVRHPSGRPVREVLHSNGISMSWRPSPPVVKEPGQGEFDNLHFAPRMTGRVNGRPVRIAMAPVCQHDCLHTHFRWTTSATELGQLGFDLSGHPHRARGTPLVPPNQSVMVTVQGGRRMDYEATCEGPIAAGSWQVINHHGSAYALRVNPLVDRMATQGNFMIDTSQLTGWPAFYFALRYRESGGLIHASRYSERQAWPLGVDPLREVELRRWAEPPPLPESPRIAPRVSDSSAA